MKFIVLTEQRGYCDERNLVHITSGFSTVVTFLVWGHLDDSFSQVVDWCHDNAPGLLDTKYVNDEFNRLKLEGKSDDEAWEGSSIDMICTGNCGDYISSETIHATYDPSRENIKTYTDHWSTEIEVV